MKDWKGTRHSVNWNYPWAEMIYSLFVYLHLSILTKYYFCDFEKLLQNTVNAVSIDKWASVLPSQCGAVQAVRQGHAPSRLVQPTPGA